MKKSATKEGIPPPALKSYWVPAAEYEALEAKVDKLKDRIKELEAQLKER